MDADKFVATTPGGDIRFGLGHLDLLAADLRRLAEAIDAGAVSVTRVATSSTAAQGDFPGTSLTLEYHPFRAARRDTEEN